MAVPGTQAKQGTQANQGTEAKQLGTEANQGTQENQGTQANQGTYKVTKICLSFSEYSQHPPETVPALLKNKWPGPDDKITFDFVNGTRFKLRRLGAYYEVGDPIGELPDEISDYSIVLFSVPKSRATAGVFSYYVPDEHQTVHLMWAVPQDYDGDYASSKGRPFLWNMVVVEGYKNPNCAVYQHLYNGSDGFKSQGPHPPGPPYDRSRFGFDLWGIMSLTPGKEGVQATLCTILTELKKAEPKEPETKEPETKEEGSDEEPEPLEEGEKANP